VAFQTYQALVNWVEKGVSPDTMVFNSPKDGYVPPIWTGFGPTVGPEMSLPACAYPTKATYTGGDIRKAASYACQ
jgi:feruloyl esterase